MAQKKLNEIGACTDRGGHCSYKFNQATGRELICDKCGRVKAIKRSFEGEWELLA